MHAHTHTHQDRGYRMMERELKQFFSYPVGSGGSGKHTHVHPVEHIRTHIVNSIDRKSYLINRLYAEIRTSTITLYGRVLSWHPLYSLIYFR